MNGWCWLEWLMLMADTDVGIETPAGGAGSWGTAGMAGIGMALRWLGDRSWLGLGLALRRLALVLLLRWLGLGRLGDGWDGWRWGWH